MTHSTFPPNFTSVSLKTVEKMQLKGQKSQNASPNLLLQSHYFDLVRVNIDKDTKRYINHQKVLKQTHA